MKSGQITHDQRRAYTKLSVLLFFAMSSYGQSSYNQIVISDTSFSVATYSLDSSTGKYKVSDTFPQGGEVTLVAKIPSCFGNPTTSPPTGLPNRNPGVSVGTRTCDQLPTNSWTPVGGVSYNVTLDTLRHYPWDTGTGRDTFCMTATDSFRRTIIEFANDTIPDIMATWKIPDAFQVFGNCEIISVVNGKAIIVAPLTISVYYEYDSIFCIPSGGIDKTCTIWSYIGQRTKVIYVTLKPTAGVFTAITRRQTLQSVVDKNIYDLHGRRLVKGAYMHQGLYLCGKKLLFVR